MRNSKQPHAGHARHGDAAASSAASSNAPASHQAAVVGFDFTAYMRSLCGDIALRLAEFQHVDMSRIALRGCQTRRPGRYGIQASLTPLRFKDGAEHAIRRGRRYGIQRVFDAAGREMLYLLSFYLPRFLDLSFEEKIATVCHELWHVGPRFDGDIRRHAHGRCYAHGPSESEFHAGMRVLAQKWLGLRPPETLFNELHFNFAGIRQRHGRVLAVRLPTPRLIPLT